MSVRACPIGHVICPYNKSHVIRTERIQFHLTKCLPSAKDQPHVVCPFNSTHLIPISDINNHKLNLCPDRIKLDTFLYEVSEAKPLFPVQNIQVDSQENWDNAEKHTYDPEIVLNEKRLLVLKQVAPPAERKKHHAEQRKKFQSLPDEPISAAKHTKPKLRQPNTKPMTHGSPKKAEIVQKVEEKKVEPIIEKMENVAINPTKKTDEFELVVGKKNKKGSKPSVNQQEAVKTKVAEPKKSEPKVKKQAVLNEKNTNDTSKMNREESANVSSKENFSVEPEEDEFIVVTKKKNKTRKH